MRALTIGELESESGTARSTIYYYVRAGLLPPAQKSSPTRAIYTDDHVELLDDIGRLKREGFDLDAIRKQLAPRVHAASENGEDLVARQGEASAAPSSYRGAGVRAQRLPADAHRRHHRPARHHPAAPLQLLPDEARPVRGVVPLLPRRDDGHHRATPRRRDRPSRAPHLAHARRLRAARLNPDLLYLARRPPTTTRRRLWSCAGRTSTSSRPEEGPRTAAQGAGCPAALRRAPVLRPLRGAADHAHAGRVGRPVLAHRRHVDQRPPAPGGPDALRRDARRAAAAGALLRIDRRSCGAGSADSSRVRVVTAQPEGAP